VIDLLETTFAEIEPEALLARLDVAGIPAGRLRTIDQVYDWDQTISQGLKIAVDHPSLGQLILPGPPLRFFAFGRDGEIEATRRDHIAPPTLGQHTATISEWLTMQPDALDRPP